MSVKNLSDVIPGEGSIPVIDLVLCRKYPTLFLEQNGYDEGTKYVLTEAQESTRAKKNQS